MPTVSQELDELIHQIAYEEVVGDRPSSESDALLEKLCSLGSELWVDTGDLDKANDIWKNEMAALTTNNTLANQVVQSGVMDETIRQTVEQIEAVATDLDAEELVTEIGFVINCKIALRLVQAFKVKVSVELHPAMSRDMEKTLAYARRYYKVCPEYFIVKIPLTPEGYLAVRELRKAGIPINYTLGFSARQNYLAARLSNPSFVNVFLGRLNQVVSDNSLGSGDMVGEKVTLATQAALWDVRTDDPGVSTRLIGASIRNGAQVGFLAGVDVLTIPPAAMQDFIDTGDAGDLRSHVRDDIEPGIDFDQAGASRFPVLWEVSDAFKEFVDSLLNREDIDRLTPEEMESFCREKNIDLFHPFSPEDLNRISGHGKIPRLEDWPDTVALDDLMTQSALQSFAKDQKALDERICSFFSADTPSAITTDEKLTILAADIGGTKVNLALFRQENNQLEMVEEATFESRNFTGLENILDEFYHKELPPIDRAGFGIAGPVKDGRCEVTNLPWTVDVQNLKKQLSLEPVWLINDLAAMACSLPFLPEAELDILQQGQQEADGKMAVLAAGTGLGEAFLVPDGSGRYLIVDSEGGHCGFSPSSKLQLELLEYLNQKYGRTSIERVLSGPGLHNIYQFLKECHSYEEPSWLAEEMDQGDPGTVITENGLKRKSDLCEKALEMLTSIYGTIAGDLALQFLTRGGLYIGGGIAPKILPLIKSGLFMESFSSKGRFKSFMREIPVKVILDPKASLQGAAHYALGKKFTH